MPLDRILVETDLPFLAPIPHRGKANEPAYVVHTAQKAAEIFGVSFGELASATTDNFFRLPVYKSGASLVAKYYVSSDTESSTFS